MGGAGADNKPVASVEEIRPATGRWALCDRRLGVDRPADGWKSVDPRFGAQAFSTVEVYDPENDTWAARSDKPTPRHMTVSAVHGRIYAIGGLRRGEVDMILPLMEAYDTATNRWAKAADVPTPRSALSSSVVDGRIYVMGGVTSQGRASSQLERMRHRTPDGGILELNGTFPGIEVYTPSGMSAKSEAR